MKIELDNTGENGWVVRCGDQWEYSLTGGEALEVVARLIFTGRAPYLKNELGHFLWDINFGPKKYQKLLTEHAGTR